MIEVRVAGVALDSAGQHVILLQPAEPPSALVLPIWIGAQEATSILIAIEGAVTPRPLAHDLMRSMLERLGARVARVEITRLEEGTFYAEVTLATASGELVIDARPSDAIALASRAGAPIGVDDTVLAEAGVVDAQAEAEHDVEEFTRFLDTVDPEDFGE